MFGNNRKFMHGDTVRSLDREFLNTVFDASVENRSVPRGPAFNSDSPEVRNEADVFLVQNKGGTTLNDQFKILAVDAPAITPSNNLVEWKSRQVFEGITPAADSQICILQRPAAANQVVPAVFSGCTPVKVEVTDATHTHAKPGTSKDKLDSGTSGPAEILWKESGTGEKWAFVRLSNTSEASSELVYATWDYSAAFATPGTITNFQSDDTSIFSYNAGLGQISIGKDATVLLEGTYTYDVTSSGFSAIISGLFWHQGLFTGRIQRNTGVGVNIDQDYSSPLLQSTTTAATGQTFDLSMAGFVESGSVYGTGANHPRPIWRDTGLLGTPIQNESFSGSVTLIRARS